MPKQKSHQASNKRFRITKTGKVLKKATGQDHFNSRETGKVGRNKRRLRTLSKSITKHIKNFIKA